MGLRFDAETVIERMAQGAFAAHLAHEFDVTKQAISKRLLRCTEGDYKAAMRQGAAVRLLAMLRRCRDYGDISRKALNREVLYCERHAPQLLETHADLIRTAMWRYCETRWPPSRLQRPQSQAVTDEILAMERWYHRLNAEGKPTES